MFIHISTSILIIMHHTYITLPPVYPYIPSNILSYNGIAKTRSFSKHLRVTVRNCTARRHATDGQPAGRALHTGRQSTSLMQHLCWNTHRSLSPTSPYTTLHDTIDHTATQHTYYRATTALTSSPHPRSHGHCSHCHRTGGVVARGFAALRTAFATSPGTPLSRRRSTRCESCLRARPAGSQPASQPDTHIGNINA